MSNFSRVIWLLVGITPISANQAQVLTESQFLSPPNSAKPHTWWHWINGNISKEGITADLEAMKQIGIGGAQIFNVEVGLPAGKVPFMTPQWKECLAHAFKEAKRLGIEICVHNCAGWSSSGGEWVKPEYAMQNLTWSETKVHGPAKFSAPLPEPKKNLDYYQDIVVYAIKDAKDAGFRIPNIRAKAGFDRGDKILPEFSSIPGDSFTPSSNIKQISMSYAGRLEWDVPEGDWTIIRMGHTPTGAVNAPAPVPGRGPEVDKLSRRAMDQFWAGMMKTALEANGTVGQFGLNNALIDSYEVGSQTWTPEFRAEFKKRRGYDPLPLLPVITGRVVENGEISERFLWDYRRTICDLYADNYFGYFKQLCHKNGLKFSTEGYGNGSFDNLQVSGLADIPMGEFWVGGFYFESTKMVASAAHTNGKPVVGAESFTADDVRGRWLVDPYSVKALGDRMFCYGINRYIFHRYTHQPWMNLEPGMTMGPWGMNLERTITWWNQGSVWMKYIARCQSMLQSGRFAADVLSFCGEEGPNDMPLIGGSVVPTGYDYDGCDTTVLMQANVENGEIVLPSGMRYKVLLLPDSKWMSPRILSKLALLIHAGATVIGPKPVKSPSLADLSEGDKRVAAVANQIWAGATATNSGSAKFGSGQVFWGSQNTLEAVLKKLKVQKDLGAAVPLNWIHRKIGSADVYFVSNPNYRPIDTTVDFRVSGKVPELWDPESGSVVKSTIWNRKGELTSVQLRLESAGSTFVVFKPGVAGKHISQVIFEPSSKTASPKPKVEIFSARYEAVDGSGGKDVTAIAQGLLASGEGEVAASNSNFGDPTVNHIKQLVIKYSINGKAMEKTIPENQALVIVPKGPDDEPPAFTLDGSRMWAWKEGKLTVIKSDGSRRTYIASSSVEAVQPDWKLTFPQRKGKPAIVTGGFVGSWTESANDEIKYFSGTATYEGEFRVQNPSPNKTALWLDLGKVKNFAEIELNGHKFETLWKAPFRVDITKWVKKNNSIKIKVTNLWPNRLIGDENYPASAVYNGGPIAAWPDWITNGEKQPETGRQTFTTWKFYEKSSPLLDSGILGPIQIRRVAEVSRSF